MREETKEPKEISLNKLQESANKLPEVTDEMWNIVLKDNRDMIEEFIKNNPQLSEKTHIQYWSALKQFFYWNAIENKNKEFYRITKRDYLRFQSSLMDRGFSSSALKLKKSAISSFNNYLESVVADDMEELKTFKNYCRGLPSLPKNKVYEKKPLNSSELRVLKEHLIKQSDWRKLAYLMISYSSAGRKDEIRQILKEVIDYKPIEREKDGQKILYYMTHKIKCKGSKRNSNKIKPLIFDQETMEYLKKYMEWRGNDDNPYLFITKQNDKINQVGESTLNLWTDSFSKVIGRRIYPHLIRSSKATIMSIEEGKDIKVIQKLLGHESSETTAIYVVRNEEDDIDDIFM
jgi:site-specific recombinase XerD